MGGVCNHRLHTISGCRGKELPLALCRVGCQTFVLTNADSRGGKEP
ncbi:3946_t:CDS:1, partial [Acaulospora colombiana]